VVRVSVKPSAEELKAMTPEDFDRAVRGYVIGVARRYLPLSAGVLAVLLLLLFVPSVPPSSQRELAGAAGAANGDAGATAAPGGQAPGQAAGTSRSGKPTATTGGGTSPGTLPGATSATGGAPSAGAASIGPVASTCAGGARQVAFSKYSALCRTRFTGSNGGSTARGVTASTITVTYRTSHSGQASAVEAASPSLKASQEDYFADLSTYTAYFNKQFQLYGRTVALKLFNGQGDWVSEYQGQNLAGAQADADTAKSLNAFADISSPAVGTTPPYAQYLAENKIVTLGGVAASQHFYQQYRPYVYTPSGSVSNFAQWSSNTICQRMVGLQAIFAGSANLKAKKRSFGLIYPNNPDFKAVGQEISKRMSACGAAPTKTYEYTLNLGTLASESANAMAQMSSSGVTTVICACDTVSPQFFTQAADGQNYVPEWVALGSADSFGQGYSQTQWAHAISDQGTFKPEKQTEAYKVFKLASPKSEPKEPFFSSAYIAAINLFNSLQNAGPQLTAANLEQGFFALPDSLPGGDFGPWSFGPQHWTSLAGAQTGWYDANATSGSNGKKGAWITCAGTDGPYRPWDPVSGYGTKSTQLRCFGRA
jgi:hypothetical protein